MRHKNLYVYQNSTYTKTVYIKNDDGTAFDLTGYNTVDHDVTQIIISKHFDSMPKYQFPVEISNVVNGIITVSIDANSTALLPSGSLVYSIWGTSSTNKRILLLQGTMFVESTVFEDVV